MKWIVSARIDLPFFILAALTGYALLGAHLALGVSSLLLWWFWNLSMNGAHFFATLARTYLDREEWRQRPGLLLGSLALIGIGPAAIWLSLGLGSGIPFLLFSLQLTIWAYYHVVRQHYGFVALYQKANGEPVGRANTADFWIFHTVMLAPAGIWLARDPRLRTNLGLGDHATAIETIIVGALASAIVAALAAAAVRTIASFRAGRLNVPKTLLLLAYVPLHLLVFLYRPLADRYDPYLMNAVLTYPHNVQYMAIVWFYARNRYHGAPAGAKFGLAARVSRNRLVFGAAAWAYGAVYYYTDWFLEGIAVPGSLGAFALARMPLAHEGGPSVADLVASIWVGFAFHHYYLDQKIWRISHDRRLVKDLRLAPAAPQTTGSGRAPRSAS
jgi:hypothetical protein